MGNEKFNKKFHALLAQSTVVNIATGYISESSVDSIAEMIYDNGGPVCNLIIGMHYFEKFTYRQYASAVEMNKFLMSNHLGGVKVVTSFPFHGKLYSFKKNESAFASIIGSSNLNNVLSHNPSRQYETDLYISEQTINDEINCFIDNLSHNASLPLTEIKIVDFRESNDLLTNLDGVRKLEDFQLSDFKNKINNSIRFDIPLKTFENKAKKSHLNTHFGKGREGKNGIIKARPWYEVELLVPKSITDLPYYPKPNLDQKSKIFSAVTDDGYQFECIVNGSGNKNFRSTGSLTVLGKWLKGRLERSGALITGNPVTQNVLDKYGRDHFSLISTAEPDVWYLDFSVNMVLNDSL